MPFEAKLRNLLSIPENETFDLDREDLNILQSKNIKSNMSDGSYIKEAFRIHTERRPVYDEDGIAVNERTLYFAIYYDDVEVVNPIGSSTKKHKLGKQSFNLNKSNQTKVEKIFL